MARQATKQKPQRKAESPVGHGLEQLPSVVVTSFNLELRDKDGFIGDRASKSAFTETLEDWRKRLARLDADPLGDVPTDELSKKKLDQIMAGKDADAAALIHGVIEEFASELAGVIRRYRRTKAWKNVGRIAAGGGFRESRVGELAIARAGALLKSEGIEIDIQPIRNHPDEAGLIGAAHLMPAWMLAGHDALLAVDIGGSNIRAGVVRLGIKKNPDLSKAEVWKFELWRHADEAPSRTAATERLIAMLETLIGKAEKEDFTLAPVIGIGCPGLIREDGSIARGGQNLPGGNWESEHFNLPERLSKAIPEIGGHATLVVMHNDAVVQGLSEVPFMQDVEEWGVVTIGTGLGNASFRNKSAT